MKIALISSLFKHENDMNIGYYPLLYNIAKKLSENIDTTVFSGGWPKYPKKDRIDNINVIRTCSYDAPFELKDWFICTHLKTLLKEDYNIINGFGNDASVLYYILNKLNKNKIKITSSMSIIRGWERTIPFPDKLLKNSWLRMKTQEFYDNLSIKNSNKIIALSNFAKNEILSIYPINPDNIEVIYPGIDTNIFKPTQVESPYSDKLILFFAGGTGFRKGSDTIIASYIELKKKYRNLLLIISGTDELQRFEPMLKKANMHIGKDIILLGNINHIKMAYYFNLCDIYLHPSYHETFGVALIEAMACKKPVVGCNSTAIPEVVKNAGLLIKPGSIKDLTSQISYLIENPKLRKTLGNKGIKRVFKNYTLEQTINNYLKLYRMCDNLC